MIKHRIIKNTISSLLIIIILFILTLNNPPQTNADEQPSNSACSSITLATEEIQFINLINIYREQETQKDKISRSKLQISKALTCASKWMSNDMAQNNLFSHVDSLNRDVATRLKEFNYDYITYNTSIGENIAGGKSSAEDTFNQWKNSSGHNSNMLNPNFKTMGIGRVELTNSKFKYYWTNDFGGFLDETITISISPTPTITPIITPTKTPTPNLISITPSLAPITATPANTPTPTKTPTPTQITPSTFPSISIIPTPTGDQTIIDETISPIHRLTCVQSYRVFHIFNQTIYIPIINCNLQSSQNLLNTETI